MFRLYLPLFLMFVLLMNGCGGGGGSAAIVNTVTPPVDTTALASLKQAAPDRDSIRTDVVKYLFPSAKSSQKAPNLALIESIYFALSQPVTNLNSPTGSIMYTYMYVENYNLATENAHTGVVTYSYLIDAGIWKLTGVQVTPGAVNASKIKGKVVNAATDKPMEGVSVYALDATGLEATRIAVTNDKGNFTITDVLANSYTVFAQYSSFDTGNSGGTLIVVPANTTVDIPNISLIPSTVPRITLRGKVYFDDAHTRPVAGATLLVKNSLGQSTSYPAVQTDAEGGFRIPFVTRGDYLIQARIENNARQVSASVTDDGVTTQIIDLDPILLANQNPVITQPVQDGFIPVVTGTHDFTVVASDPDGDDLHYYWRFNDEVIGFDSSISYQPLADGIVSCTVKDLKGGSAERQWQIGLTGIDVTSLTVSPNDVSIAVNQTYDLTQLTFTVHSNLGDYIVPALALTFQVDNPSIGSVTATVFNATATPGVTHVTASLSTANGSKDCVVTVSVTGSVPPGQADNTIAFIKNNNEIWLMDTNGSNQRFLHQANAHSINSIDFSGDGRYIVYSIYEYTSTADYQMSSSGYYLIPSNGVSANAVRINWPNQTTRQFWTSVRISDDSRYICGGMLETTKVLGNSRMKNKLYIYDVITGDQNFYDLETYIGNTESAKLKYNLEVIDFTTSGTVVLLYLPQGSFVGKVIEFNVQGGRVHECSIENINATSGRVKVSDSKLLYVDIAGNTVLKNRYTGAIISNFSADQLFNDGVPTSLQDAVLAHGIVIEQVDTLLGRNYYLVDLKNLGTQLLWSESTIMTMTGDITNLVTPTSSTIINMPVLSVPVNTVVDLSVATVRVTYSDGSSRDFDQLAVPIVWTTTPSGIQINGQTLTAPATSQIFTLTGTYTVEGQTYHNDFTVTITNLPVSLSLLKGATPITSDQMLVGETYNLNDITGIVTYQNGSTGSFDNTTGMTWTKTSGAGTFDPVALTYDTTGSTAHQATLQASWTDGTTTLTASLILDVVNPLGSAWVQTGTTLPFMPRITSTNHNGKLHVLDQAGVGSIYDGVVNIERELVVYGSSGLESVYRPGDFVNGQTCNVDILPFKCEIVSHNGKLFAVGGQVINTIGNFVFESNDGVNWTPITGSTFPGRRDHAIASFNGYMFVSGGTTPYYTNDVWSSADGITWNQVAANVSNDGYMYNHKMVEYDGYLHIFGGWGPHSNRIYSSSNGATWTNDRLGIDPGLGVSALPVNSPYDSIVRGQWVEPALVVVGADLFVIGGWTSSQQLDDVLKFDHITRTWSFMPYLATRFSKRLGAAAYSNGSEIHILGGNGWLNTDTVYSDVWKTQ